MEHLEKIIELADAELGSIAKNGKFRSREEIDSVGKLIDMTKDIYCIMDMEEGGEYSERGYSERGDRMYDRGGSYRGGSYRGNSYDGGSYEGSYDGGSYARGRGRNAKRDSMGRYSRDGGFYRNGYSRDGGKEEFMDNLRDMMQDAPDDQTRQNIQRMIQQMEQS